MVLSTCDSHHVYPIYLALIVAFSPGGHDGSACGRPANARHFTDGCEAEAEHAAPLMPASAADLVNRSNEPGRMGGVVCQLSVAANWRLTPGGVDLGRRSSAPGQGGAMAHAVTNESQGGTNECTE